MRPRHRVTWPPRHREHPPPHGHHECPHLRAVGGVTPHHVISDVAPPRGSRERRPQSHSGRKHPWRPRLHDRDHAADGSRHDHIHARGLDVLDDPQVNRGHGVHVRGARPPRPARPAAAGVETIEEQVARSLRAVPGQRDRRRQVGLPHPAARQQRGALLPARRRARPRDAADRLHADRRRGDRAVQPPVPASARSLPEHRRRRRDRQRAGRPPVSAPTTST